MKLLPRLGYWVLFFVLVMSIIFSTVFVYMMLSDAQMFGYGMLFTLLPILLAWLAYDVLLRARGKRIVDVHPWLLKLPSYATKETARESATQQQITKFRATKSVSNYLQIDDKSKQWRVAGLMGLWAAPRKYEDIVDFELLENDNSIASGGVGGAVVGGLLFGGVGAIVGSNVSKNNKSVCKSMKLKITVNDINSPTIYVDFLERETEVGGAYYLKAQKQAHECMSVLQLVCNSVTHMSAPDIAIPTGNISAADEILKYKNLLDAGAITEEEFETKKAELLTQ